MTEFVGALDCGTTSARFIVLNDKAEVIADHQIEFDQYFPHPGWMEESPQELYETCVLCIDRAVAKFEKKGYKRDQLKTIGITNQRETALVWNKTTGEPLHRAIVWPDTRNTHTIRQLEAKAKKEGLSEEIRTKSGLPFSTYFAGTKLKWLLDNVPAVKEAMDADNLMFGTVDTWLLYSLTGGVNGGLFLTDVSNASRTLFMDLATLEWDQTLLDFFGVRRSCLAKIVSNAEVYGKMACSLLKGTTISGMIGDQQSALVGQKCFREGEGKSTYGTGCFMLYNTGDKIVSSSHGLLTTPAYKAGPDAKPVYALEGSIAVAGSVIKWTRDSLSLIKEAKEIGQLAGEVKTSGGVVFVTAFSGLFAPIWDDTATGMIIGITQYTTKHHIARATLEATCFQTKAILDSMRDDSGIELTSLKVDGGMTESDVVLQIQADILNIEVVRPKMRESTALGAALCAGSAIKLFGWDLNNPSTLDTVNTAGTTIFNGKQDEETRTKAYALWNKAVTRSRGWKEEEDREVGKDEHEEISVGAGLVDDSPPQTTHQARL